MSNTIKDSIVYNSSIPINQQLPQEINYDSFPLSEEKINVGTSHKWGRMELHYTNKSPDDVEFLITYDFKDSNIKDSRHHIKISPEGYYFLNSIPAKKEDIEKIYLHSISLLDNDYKNMVSDKIQHTINNSPHDNQ